MDTCAYLDKHAMLTFFKAYFEVLAWPRSYREQLMAYRAAHCQGAIGMVWLFRERLCHPSSYTVHVTGFMGFPNKYVASSSTTMSENLLKWPHFNLVILDSFRLHSGSKPWEHFLLHIVEQERLKVLKMKSLAFFESRLLAVLN